MTLSQGNLGVFLRGIETQSILLSAYEQGIMLGLNSISEAAHSPSSHTKVKLGEESNGLNLGEPGKCDQGGNVRAGVCLTDMEKVHSRRNNI